MSSDSKNAQHVGDAPFDGTFEGTTRRQLLLGLELDATARLRWLERTMAELHRLSGRASETDSDSRRKDLPR